MKKVLKKTSGSAMVIAIIITTFVTVITIATSKLILSETQINLRYLDGIVANYAAESGVEWGLSVVKNSNEVGEGNNQNSQAIKESELIINGKLSGNYKNANFKSYVWSLGQDNSEIVIGPGETQNIGIKGAGNSIWKLTSIDRIEGDDSCPANDILFVYLLLNDGSGKTVILNRISNSTGTWTESRSDHEYYITNIVDSLELKPLILAQFLPSSVNIENETLQSPPANCKYSTKWSLEVPGSEITSGTNNIKGVGLYGDVEKELTISF